jgi:thiosulfate/3-mercaptopyruvate sulfurtransferase
MSGYARPESFASAQWVADHLNDTHVRPVEIVWGESPMWGKPAYVREHIPGAVAWDFVRDLQDSARGNVIDKSAIEALFSRSGISPHTTIILYSALQNILASYAFWLLKIYGHRGVRLLDGDRRKWLDEHRPTSGETPAIAPTVYRAPEPNWSLRAGQSHVLRSIGDGKRLLLDARSAEMYAGVDSAGAARGGHIPGAVSFAARRETNPDGSFNAWRTPTVRFDGTFMPVEELQAVVDALGITPDKEIITYCVRGGLSTHAWFVLTQLLGYPDVREYDRSWAEWGNLEGAPIEP